MGDNLLAGCLDMSTFGNKLFAKYFKDAVGVDTDAYFNSGVLLINLDYWREHNITQQLLDFVCTNPNKCLLHDQDAINAVLYGKIRRLQFNMIFKIFFFRLRFGQMKM